MTNQSLRKFGKDDLRNLKERINNTCDNISKFTKQYMQQFLGSFEEMTNQSL